MVELTDCLNLCAPTGMTTEDRKAWMGAVHRKLSGIPADLLAKGCHEAALTCDHPAKIVPCIIKTVGAEWEARKEAAEFYRDWTPPTALIAAPQPAPELSDAERADLASKLASLARTLSASSSDDPH